MYKVKKLCKVFTFSGSVRETKSLTDMRTDLLYTTELLFHFLNGDIPPHKWSVITDYIYEDEKRTLLFWFLLELITDVE